MADKKADKEKSPAPAAKDKAAKAAAAEETPAEPKKRKPLPKPLIIAAVVVVQIIAAYFLQKTLFFNDVTAAVQHEEKKTEHKAENKKGKHGEGEETSSVVMLDEIVVNPARSGGRRYLAITVGFQTAVPDADKLFEKNKPLIRDALISLLSSKDMEKLADISYRDSLKIEIREGVNRQMRDSVVSQVVFSSYVLQ
jgi:flagellar protein FliL